MPRTKPLAGYNRQNIDGTYVYVKKLDNGAEVHQCGTVFYAHDAVGNFLGTGDQRSAEYAAQQGLLLNVQTGSVSPLDLHLLWNAARDAKSTFMGSVDKKHQLLSLGFSVFIAVGLDDDPTMGQIVELVSSECVRRHYYDEDNDVYQLHIISAEQVVEL